MSEDALKQIAQRLELFQKGFEMITKNLSDTLAKINTDSAKIAENTAFMPKILESNKEIKKSTDNLALVLDGLMCQLDKIAQKNNL